MEETNKESRAIDYFKKLPKRVLIDGFSGMALGLFCTLIAGTIISQISKIFAGSNFAVFLENIATFAKVMMGAGIGVGTAHALKAPKLVLPSVLVVGFIGAFANIFIAGNTLSLSTLSPGDPLTSYLCAVVACEIGILVSGKTKIDILVVPLSVLITGGLVAYFLGAPVSKLMQAIGSFITYATGKQPFIMGIIVAVVMGLLLTLPTSSAAIGIAIGLSGISAGAAVAGCCAHMIGFAVASFRENKWSGVVAQGLGTSMLQIPNLSKNIKILVPAVAASLVAGPLASTVFGLHASKVGSGMGSAGLVGIIDAISHSLDIMPVWKVIFGVSVCYIVVPAAVALIVSEFMRKKNYIKYGDMKIDT